jgi:hypothetical protein
MPRLPPVTSATFPVSENWGRSTEHLVASELPRMSLYDYEE